MRNLYYSYPKDNNTEQEKTLNYIYNIIKSKLFFYQSKLPFAIREDYVQDVLLEIIKCFKKQLFKFDFYKTLNEFEKEVLNENGKEKYFLKCFLSQNENNQKLYLLSKVDKKALHLFYEKYKDYTFYCRFLGYLNKLMYVQYIKKYQQQKNVNEFNYSIDRQVVQTNIFVSFNYLSVKDKKLLSKFFNGNKILSKEEVAKNLNVSSKTIANKLNKIFEKLDL